MGVLCDVYISDPKRALQYNFRGECDCDPRQDCGCWDEYDCRNYERIESHRVYDHDFAQLLSILRGKTHRPSVIKEFKRVKQFSAEGPWIQRVPEELTERLAAVPSNKLRSISEEWAEHFIPWAEEEHILAYLKLFQKLCKKSVKTKQSMYLWTCL